MKPVMQTRFEVGKGNCLNACVASLLELPLGVDGVPEDKEALRAWLLDRDMGILWVHGTAMTWPGAGSFHIASGRSPRTPGIHHAIVCDFDPSGHLRYVHDPHPDGPFLSGDPTSHGFIVRMGHPR